MEKCAVFLWKGDLMNRLIPRSWGENLVNIFLDLSKYISHFFALHRSRASPSNPSSIVS
jgi:hypothetical protein